MEGIIDCLRYIEGQKKPVYWVDWQNCDYHTREEEDEFGLIDGKKYWIILYIKGKLIVDEATDIEDVGKEWNYKNNCVRHES